jgi:hypothetical protein
MMESDATRLSAVCKVNNCGNVNKDGTIEMINQCRKSLDNCSLGDDCSLYEDRISAEATLDRFDEGKMVLENENVCMTNKIVGKNNNDMVIFDNMINKKPNHYKNIQIYQSQNVHIGDVTHINGPIYINQLTPTINQTITINTNTRSNPFPIVDRRTWLAQPPLDPEDVKYFSSPRKFVIICHSASEEAYTQTDNNLLVRLIQQFHIESRKWNDIAYNFLVGADCSIYEGRGWDIIGAHTLDYNSISIGICFIGCYMNKLPPPGVLKMTQEFIRYGVKIGAIAEDYVLLGHCQCRSSENPGRKLFEEIQKWDRWDGSISVGNPSPLKIQHS